MKNFTISKTGSVEIVCHSCGAHFVMGGMNYLHAGLFERTYCKKCLKKMGKAPKKKKKQ